MRTSATVDCEAAFHIREMAHLSGDSCSSIVVYMIKLIDKRISSPAVLSVLTEYQRHNPESLEKLDYIPDSALVDRLGYIRWFYRVSISMLINVCFLLFWDEVVCYFLGIEDRAGFSEIWQIFLDKYEQIQKKYRYLIEYYINRFDICWCCRI